MKAIQRFSSSKKLKVQSNISPCKSTLSETKIDGIYVYAKPVIAVKIK